MYSIKNRKDMYNIIKFNAAIINKFTNIDEEKIFENSCFNDSTQYESDSKKAANETANRKSNDVRPCIISVFIG
jgi:hypothetical protein